MILACHHISKEYPEQVVLRDITFHLEKGDKAAIVGSVNWDYRSLYLHFESAVWMCGTDTVLDVKNDLLKSFEASDEVLREELNFRRGWSLFRLILRLIAPIF